MARWPSHVTQRTVKALVGKFIFLERTSTTCLLSSAIIPNAVICMLCKLLFHWVFGGEAQKPRLSLMSTKRVNLVILPVFKQLISFNVVINGDGLSFVLPHFGEPVLINCCLLLWILRNYLLTLQICNRYSTAYNYLSSVKSDMIYCCRLYKTGNKSFHINLTRAVKIWEIESLKSSIRRVSCREIRSNKNYRNFW